MMNMKPSGVQWLGDIPSGWKLAVLGKYVKQVKNKNTALLETNLLSLSYGKIKRKDITANDGLLPASFDGYNIIEEGDIVLRLTDLQNDHTSLRVGRATERGIITSAYITIRPEQYISSEYLYYVLHSFDIVKGFYGMGAGIRQGLTYDGVQSLKIPSPSLAEQQDIANYLDDRCSKIDEIIAEATASIEEYKELKQAVIFEAVTKGLDKNVPMRQSNVGWIDRVPCSWNVGKLRLLAEFYNGDRSSRYPSGNDIKSEGIIFVTSNNLGNIRLNIDIPTNKYITKEKYDELGGAKLRIDDIVFCLRGSVGKCSINKIFDAGTIASSLVVIRPKRINPDYLNYVLQTSRITDEAIVSAIGIGSANLAAHDISEFFVPVPSKAEQQEIVDFLDVRVGDMDALISEKQALIDDLQAYKKSLIYEVVTGKRRVV